MNNKVKVLDYADVLAIRWEGTPVYFSEEGGSYQGKYVAVLEVEQEIDYEKENAYYVFVGSYGSCSGCDWLKSEGDYDYEANGYFIDAKLALEYGSQSKPIYILPDKPTEEWVNKLAEKVNN